MQPEVIVTTLLEPLTEVTRARLRSNIRKDIARGNFLHVVDLSKLGQLDASTLSELIRVRRWLREVGGMLSLVADQPNILKILTIAGLDRVFGVYPSNRHAMDAMSSSNLIPA